jgi:hypothetical protein
MRVLPPALDHDCVFERHVCAGDPNIGRQQESIKITTEESDNFPSFAIIHFGAWIKQVKSS